VPLNPEPYDAAPPPPRRTRPAWLRARGAIAGAAVGVLAVGALGGFAVGHATGGDGGTGDRSGQIDRGFAPDGHHAPPGQPPGGFSDDDGDAPRSPGQGGSAEGSDTAYRS
jgi:hypothetical protein